MKSIRINNTSFTKEDADLLMSLLEEFLREKGETDSQEGKKLRQVLKNNIDATFADEQKTETAKQQK